LDDMDTAGNAEALRFIDAHPNIEVRLYNPFPSRTKRMSGFIRDFGRLNHRMHNKTLTVDNQASIFGGRNIGNEYFNATENVGFDDLDALAIGPVVREVSISFDEYWNSEWVYPQNAFKSGQPVTAEAIAAYRKQSADFITAAKQSDYAVAVQEFSYDQLVQMNLPFEWSEWQVAYDHPGKIVHKERTLENSLAPQLAQMARNVNKDLIIVSPYFVPGHQLTKTMVELTAKGIRVRILTNSLASNDVAAVFAGYKKYRKDLLEAGVELYEFKATKDFKAQQQTKDPSKKLAWKGASRASLHAKYFVFDLENIFIGSFNLDGRSVAINTEFGVYFKSPTYAQMVNQGFEQHAFDAAYQVTLNNGNLQWVTRENGETVYLDKEPDTNFFQRFGASLSGLFVPEGQL
jgi:putative cardiolipin synthase